MANNTASIPPSGKNSCRGSQVVITSDMTDPQQAVNEHFAKSGEVRTRQWQERNLPEGFFSKPSAKSSANTSVAHSRDPSTDSSGRYTMSPPAAFGGASGGISAAPNASTAGHAGTIQHSRTQSAPVSLSGQMSLPPSGPPSVAPGRGSASIGGQQSGRGHRSVDNTLDVDNTLLPYGWERKFTEHGQPFYINSIDKTITWEDPRKSLSASNLSHGTVVCSQPNTGSAAAVAASAQLGPLPPGWEEAITPNGEKYYINHNDKSTSWYDPRLPEEVQKPIIVQRLLNQQHGQMNVGPSSCAVGGGPVGYPNQHALGQAARSQLPPHPPVNSRAMAGAAASSSPTIQKLNQERLRIYERNMELRDQGLLDRLSPVHPLSPGHNVGNDAFLGAGAANQYAVQMAAGAHYPTTAVDFHVRQGSSDSGLGMPVGYPHTPENYLGSSDIDLSFSGINLVDPGMPMDVDVDASNIPATLDGIGIAPNELDQYLHH